MGKRQKEGIHLICSAIFKFSKLNLVLTLKLCSLNSGQKGEGRRRKTGMKKKADKFQYFPGNHPKICENLGKCFRRKISNIFLGHKTICDKTFVPTNAAYLCKKLELNSI